MCYDNTMTKTETKTDVEPSSKGCRFPVAADRLCGRPVVATSGGPNGQGRPSHYCDNPDHNRAAAWRARRAFQEQQTGQEVPQEVLTRPVTSAGNRAMQLVDEVRALITGLSSTQEQLLRELAVLGDPDATAVELSTVTADAAEQVAIAGRRLAEAEAGRREDQARREEADAAAVELAEQLAGVEAQLANVRADLAEAERNLAAVEAQNAEQDEALNELRQANGQQFSEIERLTEELDAEQQRAAALQHTIDVQAGVRAELETGLTRAEDEARYLRQQLDTVTGERDDLRRRAEAAETKAELAAAQITRLDDDVTSLRATVEQQRDEVRAQLDVANNLGRETASLTAQLEAAKQALAAEQNHANQRVSDIERVAERQLTELRAEVERLRSGKK